MRPEVAPASVAAPSASTTADAFLDVHLDVKKHYPLRAKLLHAGSLFETESGPRVNGPGTRSVLVPLVVIGSGKARPPDEAETRTRVLCEEDAYRVAIWLASPDLGHLAAKPTIVRPGDVSTAPTSPETPGIHLAVGALVSLAPGSSPGVGPCEVHYRGLFAEGDGKVDGADIGEIFVPVDPPPRATKADGEISRLATFFDAPGGAVIGRVGKPPTSSNQLFVELLGAPNAGHLLVRYEDGANDLVGWVKAAEVTMFPKRLVFEGGFRRGIGVGSMRVREPTVDVPGGTLLMGTKSRDPMGVTTEKATFHCVDDCDGAAPVIEAHACTDMIRMRVGAKRP